MSSQETVVLILTEGLLSDGTCISSKEIVYKIWKGFPTLSMQSN